MRPRCKRRSITPFETFEFLPKLGKSSYRRKPVSSHFKLFGTPAFAGVTVKSRFSKVSILDTLANHQPKTLGQIEQAVMEKGIGLAQLLQAVMILSSGALLAVQDEATTHKAKKHTEKLNAFLMNKARSSGDINYLASPVTGGGIMVGRFQQLFLLAKNQGKKQPDEWAQFVWQVLNQQGQRIIKEGKTLETAEENLAELTVQANTFAEKQLPILKALGIA